MAPVSTTAPSMTVAAMPTKLPLSRVQAWIRAIWPTVTWSPMMAGRDAESTWITVPS